MPSAKEEIFQTFAHRGTFRDASPHGGGHINDTFLVRTQEGDEPDYILQKINKEVFAEPEKVMENIVQVTDHMAAASADSGKRTSPILTPVPALGRNGYYHSDSGGDYWRLYLYIRPSRSYDRAPSPAAAREGGRAFGRFQRLLSDLPGDRLHETIPLFHHMPSRLQALEEGVRRDKAGRAGTMEREIAFAFARSEEMSRISLMGDRGLLPLRVTHNDTKFNNVLLDEEDKALCVVDLDTVMPGYIHFDFGDMVRTSVSGAGEDERDLSRLGFKAGFFRELARGFLEETGAVLTREERDTLYLSGKTMAFIMGIRFLTDYLNGDTYFKISRPDHNRDRCLNQFRLVEILEEEENFLIETLKEIFGEIGCTMEKGADQ